MGGEKYYYCKVCDEQIDESDVAREPLSSREKFIWSIIIVAMIGVGLIPILMDVFWGFILGPLLGIGPFLLFYFLTKKKQYCPECGAKLEISEESFIEEEIEPKTAREKVLKKAGKKITTKKEPEKKKEEIKEKKEVKKKKKEEKELPEEIFCPYCGSKIKSNVKRCPNCGTKIEDR